ncbi:MAG TPA: hypothetical protein VG276_29125, partial [Actinomycetes bacterium]|nr:hypothetical protein [Actinomycetes bacterium]
MPSGLGESGLRGQPIPKQEGTWMVSRLRRGRARVELRFDDPSQTPDVGLLLVAELAERLDLVGTLDRHIGAIKQRRRGLGGGGLV